MITSHTRILCTAMLALASSQIATAADPRPSLYEVEAADSEPTCGCLGHASSAIGWARIVCSRPFARMSVRTWQLVGVLPAEGAPAQQEAAPAERELRAEVSAEMSLAGNLSALHAGLSRVRRRAGTLVAGGARTASEIAQRRRRAAAAAGAASGDLSDVGALAQGSLQDGMAEVQQLAQETMELGVAARVLLSSTAAIVRDRVQREAIAAHERVMNSEELATLKREVRSALLPPAAADHPPVPLGEVAESDEQGQARENSACAIQ